MIGKLVWQALHTSQIYPCEGHARSSVLSSLQFFFVFWNWPLKYRVKMKKYLRKTQFQDATADMISPNGMTNTSYLYLPISPIALIRIVLVRSKLHTTYLNILSVDTASPNYYVETYYVSFHFRNWVASFLKVQLKSIEISWCNCTNVLELSC